MGKIYIDYTNGALGNKSVRYHGGGDFCRYILYEIENYVKDFRKYEVVLLWPYGSPIASLSDEEKNIREKFNYVEIKSLVDVNYHELDIIFLPLVDSWSVSHIGKIRSVHPKIKIYCILHGVRLLDICKYDKYDKYYYSGLKSISIILWGRRWIAGGLAMHKLKKNLPLADRVYTVSNNSMQQINKIAKVKYIKYFTRNIAKSHVSSSEKDKTGDKFILFVNSNRHEKNFLRSLIAYCRYIEMTNSTTKLYALGISDILKKNIQKIKSINIDIVHSKVIFLDYVETKKLNELYKNCEFLLYTSKSEGYGLPPLEAMNAGRPTVASSITSIPEVLGMAAYYVNPYSIDDIIKGIAFMDLKEHQELYVQKLNVLKKNLLTRGDFDIRLLVEELFTEI